MASKPDQPQQPGLPDTASIIEVVDFTPPTQGEPGTPGAQATPTKYRILKTTEMDLYDTPEPPQGAEAGEAVQAVPAGDAFQGTSRKAAKLSIGHRPVEGMEDLQDLINSLPADKKMENHSPPITTTANSGRVKEEDRNVRVQAFLYAASREKDNDFHLIIGRERNLAPHLYMTMEISGLPTKKSKTYPTLKAVRDKFKQFFGSNLPGMRYDFYDPPIPIQVQGSVFFDMTHVVGHHPGPPSLQPYMPTIWEVHPITDIVFEP